MSSIFKLWLGVILAFTLAADPAFGQDAPAKTPSSANNDQVDLNRFNPNNNNRVSSSTDNLTGSGVAQGTSDTSLHGTGETSTTGPLGGTDKSIAGNAYRGWWTGGIVLAILVTAFVLFNVFRKPDNYSSNLRAGDSQ